MNQTNSDFQRRTTADGFDTLYSPADGQTFHSKYGALFEAEHVFLKGSGVRARLEAGQPTRVLEVGFGTGLNFWITAHYSRLTGTPLTYVALEKILLPADVLAGLNHADLLAEAQDLPRTFIAWREHLPEPLPAEPLHWSPDGAVHLTLVIGDATAVAIPGPGYQAIYHDAFSPDANPELWDEIFFARLYPLLEPDGRLTSYSVKGTVRRALRAVGFQVEKQPGPPGKREMLVARR